MKAKENKSDKNSLLVSGLVCVGLVFLGWFLRFKIETLKKNNAQNLAILNQALPNFDNQSASRLQQEIRDLKLKLLGLSAIFDPKYKWIKKNYDFSIYFVEELGNVKQFLKQKSQEKQVAYPELGFKEQLPSETDAIYLLSQLYGLKEMISLGMDYGINFKSIAPGAPEEKAPIPGIKLIKTNLVLNCPAQALIEFLIQLNEVVPKVCFDSVALKSQGAYFDIDLTVEHIVIETDLNDKQELPTGSEIREFVSKADDNFIHILRSNNPFFVPQTKQILLTKTGSEQPAAQKPKIRFIYRGTAILKSKQVVVIEDTLKHETVFVGLDEKIGNFALVDFSDDQITLKNTDDNQELIIKREER